MDSPLSPPSIEDPATGQRIVFLQTDETTRGELLERDLFVRPAGFVPSTWTRIGRALGYRSVLPEYDRDAAALRAQRPAVSP